MGLSAYLVLSSILFCIGLFGALSKRNIIIILMCIEIMLSAVNLVLVSFSRYLIPDQILLTGHVFAMFIIVVAAAEAGIALAIIISLYRRRATSDATEIDLLKW